MGEDQPRSVSRRWWVAFSMTLFVALILTRVIWGVATAGGRGLGMWWLLAMVVVTALLYLVIVGCTRFAWRGSFRLVASLRRERPEAVVVQAVRTADLLLGLKLIAGERPDTSARVASAIVCVFDSGGAEIWDAGRNPRLLLGIAWNESDGVTVDFRDVSTVRRAALIMWVCREGAGPIALPFVVINAGRGFGDRLMDETGVRWICATIQNRFVRAST